MSYIVYIEVDDKGEITNTNSDPFHPVTGLGKTMSELLLKGHLIDPFPEPEEIKGKMAVLMWNGTTVYYRYDDVIPTEDDKIEELRNDLDNAILELTMAMAMQGGSA